MVGEWWFQQPFLIFKQSWMWWSHWLIDYCWEEPSSNNWSWCIVNKIATNVVFNNQWSAWQLSQNWPWLPLGFDPLGWHWVHWLRTALAAGCRQELLQLHLAFVFAHLTVVYLSNPGDARLPHIHCHDSRCLLDISEAGGIFISVKTCFIYI